jgi:hypothetical protein
MGARWRRLLGWGSALLVAAAIVPVCAVRASRYRGENFVERHETTPTLEPSHRRAIERWAALTDEDGVSPRMRRPIPEVFVRQGCSLKHFNAQERDPIWAPAMETILKDRLQRAISEMPGATLIGAECKTSLCKVAIDLSVELKASLSERSGPDGIGLALDVIRPKIGPLASGMRFLGENEKHRAFRWPLIGHWLMREYLRRMTREEFVLFFDENTWDPADYVAWSDDIRVKWQARAAARAARP